MFPLDVPRQHKNTRRAHDHDYHSRSIYMITLSKAPGIMDFSRLCGSLDDPNFPPQVSFLPIGRAIRYEITRLQQLYSKIYIPRYVIMPDHIHLLIYVKERTDQHLGRVLVGPFIHPEEKAWIGNAIENGGKIIKIESNGFRERYKPGRGLIDLCAEGRLLIVAPPEYQPRKKKPDRAECLRMNELAEKLSHPGLQWQLIR